MNFNIDIYPDELAESLSKLAKNYNKNTTKEIEDFLYNFKAICENPYNASYYRTFWKVLERIVEVNYDILENEDEDY